MVGSVFETSKSLIVAIYQHENFAPFSAWSIWLLVGTIFYAYKLNLEWGKGFYMAVNVGYSIGWGYPAEDSIDTRMFSVVFVLVGSAGVAAALGMFARSMIASSKNWYAMITMRDKYIKATGSKRFLLWCKLNDKSLKMIGLWVIWIALLILFALFNVDGWNFTSALYFAVSSLSTGGLWAVPIDSPEWYFGVVGFFAATGIPLMAMAMANIASMLITIGDPDQATKTIAAPVTLEELQMMQKFQLDDGDGQISRAEYILLCTVRLGAMSPKLIERINNKFKLLDTSGDGSLSYAEILEDSAIENLELHGSTNNREVKKDVNNKTATVVQSSEIPTSSV